MNDVCLNRGSRFEGLDSQLYLSFSLVPSLTHSPGICLLRKSYESQVKKCWLYYSISKYYQAYIIFKTFTFSMSVFVLFQVVR